MATTQDNTGCTVAELNNILHPPSTGYFQLPTEDHNEVWPRLYIGNGSFALDRPSLQSVGITHVLNVAQGESLGKVNTDAQFYKSVGIKFKGIKADDVSTFNLSRFWEETGKFIHKALNDNGKVLVHCYMGFSRAASTTIAYLMLYHNMSAQEATRTVKQKRNIGPNEGFLQQLCELDKKLMGKRKHKM
ncbi:dual specificity protein phosphatase 3-like [Saccoglossus kowalevskii]|uniref:Dual specificity protein phosphatase n=1 Tax=Saccoglossus kowalevskii TaxID=10224 RepID=A0ABM0MCN4_SACKO|nr:PREDICTED: dual specificity protein phosphatase 3-like [Saccoglossus kowalevskii]